MLINFSYGVSDGESPNQNIEARFELQNTEGTTQRKPSTFRPSCLEAERLGVV